MNDTPLVILLISAVFMMVVLIGVLILMFQIKKMDSDRVKMYEEKFKNLENKINLTENEYGQNILSMIKENKILIKAMKEYFDKNT